MTALWNALLDAKKLTQGGFMFGVTLKNISGSQGIIRKKLTKIRLLRWLLVFDFDMIAGND